jgi:hypothetical protein
MLPLVHVGVSHIEISYPLRIGGQAIGQVPPGAAVHSPIAPAAACASQRQEIDDTRLWLSPPMPLHYEYDRAAAGGLTGAQDLLTAANECIGEATLS